MRLVSWIGGNDLGAAEADSRQIGAIASTLNEVSAFELHLIGKFMPSQRWHK